MHRFSNYVIAYHGCDKEIQERVVSGGAFKKSRNAYDWLGNGVYFWENDELRALEWARELKKRGKISNPAVVGAVIDMGNCLDLTQRESVDLLRVGYNLLMLRSRLSGIKVPENHTVNRFGDILERDLDCAVIEQIHSWVELNNPDKVFDVSECGENALESIYSFEDGSIYCEYPMIAFNMQEAAAVNRDGIRIFRDYEKLKEWWKDEN